MFGSVDGMNFGLKNLCFYGGGDKDVLRLIKAGAQLENERGLNGMYDNCTALHLASERGHLNIVELLAESGCKIDARSLRCAAYTDHPEVCEFLIGRGLDPAETSGDGHSALSGYGRWLSADNLEDRRPPLSKEQTEAGRKRLTDARAAWVIAEALRVKRLRNWEHRKDFLLVMTGCGFQPLHKAQAAEPPPLPPDAAIPPIALGTKAQRIAHLNNKVFCHPGLWRHVASYL